MPISVNATLNLAINAKSVGPAISSIQKEFENKKISLKVNLEIPKGIDREIYRVSNAFRTLDDRMRSLSFSTAAGLSHIQAFVTALTGVGQSLNKTISPSAKSVDQAAKAITNLTKQTKVAKEETSSLAEAVGVSAKRFASFAIAAGVIANVVFQFQKGSDAALQFDRELVKLKQVGGDSRVAIEGIADRVTYLSKTLGVSSSELIKNATTLRQAGLSASDTKLALDSLAKTTLAPTFDSIGNTTEGVIAILSQFGQGVGALEAQLGSINRVAADFAVESGDLVEAVKRTGGAFVSAGGNLEELLALFTSVRATTRESAESIATSFRTIFARLQRPETIKNLRDIGIELQDLEGHFVGPYEAVKRLNAGLANLPTSTGQFAKIVEEIGGVRQISKVIPLIQQFPIAIKAYNSAIEGQSSLTRDAAIAQEAFFVKINKLKESFLELFRIVVSNDAFRTLLDLTISLTKQATDLVAAFKPLVPLLVGFASIKLGAAIFGAGSALRAGFQRRGFASGGVVDTYANGGAVGTFASAKIADKTVHLADGGTVPVTPNTGIRSGTDTVPALLTEGEYVINRNSAKAIGYDVLNELNTYSKGGSINNISNSGTKNSISTYASGGALVNNVASVYHNANINNAEESNTGGIVSTRNYANGGSVTNQSYDSPMSVNNFYSKAKAFDSGGAVPITPNTGMRMGTDTVPALLTEGEYVIKKSAAQSIGYDTLDQINNYANGGNVSTNIYNNSAENLKSYASTNLSPHNSSLESNTNSLSTYANGGDVINNKTKNIANNETNISTSGSGVVQNIKNSRKAAMLALTTRSGNVSKEVTIVVPKIKLKKDIAANISPDVSAVKADFTVAGPSTKFQDDVLTGTFKSAIKHAITSIASKAFNAKVPEIDDSIYDKVIDRSGQGRMFEAVLQAIGQNKVESNNQAFDFPGGVKGELADIFPGAAGKIGDAKLADNTKSQIGIVSKMLRSPQFSLGNKSKTTYEEFHKKAEKSYEKEVLKNPLSLSGLDYQQSREKLKGLSGIEVVKFPKPKKVTGFANGGIVGGRAGIRVTGGGIMATGNRFANGGSVGRRTGIKISGGGMMPFGHAKGGKVLGFAGGGKVPSGFSEIESGGGYIRPKVVGTSFPSGFNLNKLVSDVGIQLSNFVKKITYKAEEYQVAGRNITGHFNPKDQSVTAVSGQIPTVLHEVGHAVDFRGSSSPQLSEGENVNSLINSTIKAYINASGKGGLFENQRLIGHGSLSNYKPEKYRREAFADLFAGHTIQEGIKSGKINENDLPESTRKFLSNPNVKKLLNVFGEGLGQAVSNLPKVQSNKGYGVAASELASSGNSNVPPPRPPVTATGETPEDNHKPRKDRTTRLLEEGLEREKAAKTETISAKAVQKVLIDKDAIKARQAEREEIAKNAGLRGQTGKKVDPFAGEEHFGIVEGKFKTKDEYGKAIEEDAKNIAKSKTKAKKTIEDLGSDLEVGVVKLEQVGNRVRARVKLDTGEVKVFESQNAYNKPKLVQNRINKLTDRGFNAEHLLAGRGGFNEVDIFNENNKPTGYFGKAKSFVKDNFKTAAGALLFTAPALQQRITGTAEQPGAFGETGAKIGAGFTGAIEGAAFGAGAGSFAGPIGVAVGGIVGGLGGLVTSLNSFALEVDKIAKDKLAKSFSGLEFDVKTGKAKSDLKVSEVEKAFAGIKDIGIVFDKNKFDVEKSNEEKLTGSVVESIKTYDFSTAIFAGLKQIGLGDKKNSVAADIFAPESTESRKVTAQTSINEFSEQLQEIIKRGIDANPEKSFESFKTFGPKLFQGNTAFQILEKSLDTDAINNLKEYFNQVKQSTEIQKKFSEVQSEANKHLSDLGTALDTLNTGFELAGENFQKNTIRSNLTSEALSGKVSAGVSAPGLALFGEFGKNLESFAKPGGQLDQLRPEISKAIDVGLSNALPGSELEKQGLDLAKVTGLKNQGDIINATRALSGPESEEKALASGDLAEQFLKDKIPSNNPFASSITSVVKNTLAKNFANTEKTPTEDLRSKLTEDVIGQFKNLQQARNAANKQLESGFQNFNQQIGGFAERRSAVLQKGVDFENRAEEFNFQNKTLAEEISGNRTRFTPQGPISSRELLAQEEIQKSTRQRSNQLESFGISINPAEKDFAPDILKVRLANAQKDLSAAVVQQENANNTGDIKAFQEASKRVVDLSFTINNLKKGMDLLANSTGVLEAKNKSLSIAADKLRSDLAGRQSDAEVIRFGSTEDKQRLFQAERLTQFVVQNRDPSAALSSLDDESRNTVFQRLKADNRSREFATFNRFGKQTGVQSLTNEQIIETLTKPVLSQLTNNFATRSLEKRVDVAREDVANEQENLNKAGRIVHGVENKDLSDQRKAIDDNFAKYINDLNDTFNKNSEVFNDFASAANNLATVLATNPVPSEIILKNDSNINVNLNQGNIGNIITNEARNVIRDEIRTALIRNGVITDKTPART